MFCHPAYDYLFCQDYTASNLRDLGNDQIFRYRTKTIKSGPVLECEIFPIWNTKSELRKAKAAVSREAQKALNSRNAWKKMTRLVDTNFTEHDLFVTLTYASDPPDQVQALKDMQNYIRRIRDWRRKNELEEMKYIYVIEHEDPEDGKKGKRIHQHMFISDMGRDALEALWGKGRANTKRLQPDDYGLQDLTGYMLKSPKTKKRWYGSKNLKKPIVTTSDTRISRRMALRIAEDLNDAAAAILHKAYPGYGLTEWRAFSSEFVSGLYIYAKMHQRPDWEQWRKAKAAADADMAGKRKKKPKPKPPKLLPRQDSLFDWANSDGT